MSPPKTRTEWKLSELAAEAGVSPRTVRYYVQRGLLAAPPFKGPDTVYGEEHLLRLKAIRVLQGRFLPLDAIQAELERLDATALRGLVEQPGEHTVPPLPGPRPPLPVGSAPVAIPVPGPAPDATGWRRWELAPGLELHLADTADAQTQALAQHLRALLQKTHER